MQNIYDDTIDNIFVESDPDSDITLSSKTTDSQEGHHSNYTPSTDATAEIMSDLDILILDL